ncbi:MAG: lysophospholipase [Candidatus Cyclobacteriaceae bacterium M3_2C_046]
MVNHHHLKWIAPDGTEIFAQVWEPTHTKAQAIVCLVHGLGDHTSRYDHVAQAFCSAGIILFGADLRGHGRSGGARGHIPNQAVVLKDIDLLLDQARLKYPALPVFLYGHSMGGLLVLYYGLKQKPKIMGVIATSAGLQSSLEKQPFKVMVVKILGAIMPQLVLSNGLDAETVSRDKNVVEAYKQDPLVHDKISLGLGKMLLEVKNWTMKQANEFGYPLLIMHGKADQLTYATGSEKFAALVPEKSKLVLWKDAFHELHNEPEGKDVIQEMVCWVLGRMEV